MWADPAVVRYIGGVPFSREQAWTRFLRQAGVWHHMGFGFFVLEDKHTGAFAGGAGSTSRCDGCDGRQCGDAWCGHGNDGRTDSDSAGSEGGQGNGN